MFFYTVILLQLVPLIINNIAVPKRMLLFFILELKSSAVHLHIVFTRQWALVSWQVQMFYLELMSSHFNIFCFLHCAKQDLSLAKCQHPLFDKGWSCEAQFEEVHGLNTAMPGVLCLLSGSGHG